MQRKAIWASIVVVLLGALAIAQAQESYLDVYTVQVKPEKRADFDAISKRIVAANRQNGGDSWLAIETVYGPGNRVTFISTRTSYGDIEKATGDRKSTRLNSSHPSISYAVFRLKKKKSVFNYISRESINTSTIPSIKIRKIN